MKRERHPERRRGALARAIVRGRADAAEAEDRVGRSKSAPQGRGKPLAVVAAVLAPGEPQSAPAERPDQEGEVLVPALADENLVADDQCAEPQASVSCTRWARQRQAAKPAAIAACAAATAAA
jgi:hypothetical protein